VKLSTPTDISNKFKGMQSLVNQSMDSENYLFARDKLTGLSCWAEIDAQLKTHNLQARPLKRSDFDNGYLELLAQLTIVGEITREEFLSRFDSMKLINEAIEHYLVVVIEDLETKKLIAASTLCLELKFIHRCAVRARLEEVVVHETHRGKRIGEKIVRIIVCLADEVCKSYKISLDCTDELLKFYERNGFTHRSNMVSVRFDRY